MEGKADHLLSGLSFNPFMIPVNGIMKGFYLVTFRTNANNSMSRNSNQLWSIYSAEVH
jgi:hypothetical protein